MVAVEHVYLVRVTNMSPKDIIDHDEKNEVFTQFVDQSRTIADDISSTIFEKYCNKNKDNVDVEIMKVQPIEYEDFIEMYGLE